MPGMPQTDPLIQYVLPAALGFFGAMLGSLAAPRVNWGIEKLRQRNQARRELIAEARAAVAQHDDVYEFRKSVPYGRIRPYLSAEALNYVEATNTIHVVLGTGGGINPYKPLVMRDINKLEQEWELL